MPNWPAVRGRELTKSNLLDDLLVTNLGTFPIPYNHSPICLDSGGEVI